MDRELFALVRPLTLVLVSHKYVPAGADLFPTKGLLLVASDHEKSATFFRAGMALHLCPLLIKSERCSKLADQFENNERVKPF